MKEYIEKQLAIDVAREDGKKIPTLAIRIMHDIKSIPAEDVVPVVRCKDCKDVYCRTYQNWQEPIYTCTRFRSKWNTDYDLEVNPNDFCNYGKRKE